MVSGQLAGMIFSSADYDERPIWFVNRMLVVLRPREPFLHWVNALPETREPPYTMEELRADASSFLIPVFDYPEDAWAWVEDHYLLLFETQLWHWTDDEGLWPGGRGWEAFQEWFHPELMSAPWDLVTGPLSSDPPPPAGDEGWH